MIKLLARLWRWLATVFGWTKVAAPKNVYRAVACSDEPDRLERLHVYLLGDPGSPWSASLICPCGCDAIIRLSLLDNDRPHWAVKVTNSGMVTFHPSIWRVRGCRSHFRIREGRVIWSGPDATSPVMLKPPIKPAADGHL